MVIAVGETGLVCPTAGAGVFPVFDGDEAETERENLELTKLRAFLAEPTACAKDLR